MPFRRTIYMRELRLSQRAEGRAAATLGPIMRVNGPTADPSLGAIEKNWSPFALAGGVGAVGGTDKVFVHRWLDFHGEAIVHELDLSRGALSRSHRSSNGKLREVLGGPRHTESSGGEVNACGEEGRSGWVRHGADRV